MTKSQKQIAKTIAYYTNLLNKEMSYSEDLRNDENISRYKANIKKLEAM